MALGSAYLAMLLSNWGEPDAAKDFEGPSAAPEASLVSMWARVGALWALHALYLWNLLAPVFLPDDHVVHSVQLNGRRREG
jgi:hypothetical protein